MAAKRGRVEIIEVLPADPPRFDDGSDAPTAVVGPARGRRWWIVPGAVAAIAAVVVGAGLLSDSGSSDRTQAERSTGDSVLRADAALAPAVLPLVPATPPGYRVVGVAQTAATAAGDRRPVRQLWATNTDTALLASWLEITAAPGGLDDEAAGDRRVAVPGGIAVLDTKPDGNIRIVGPLAGGGEALIDSAGVSRPTLVELLSSLRFDGDALSSSDARLGGMFEQVAADDGAPVPAGAMLTVSYDAVVEQPNKRDDFTVTVGSLGVPYDEAARRFFLSRRADVTVNAQAAVVGSDERQFGVQSITFERAGLRVAVAGTAPRSVLLDATQSVHVATGDELAALLAVGPPPSADRAAATDSAVELAAGHFAGGDSYSVSLDPVANPDGTVVVRLTSGDVARLAALRPHDSYIATVASPTMTVLVAFVPPGVDGARLVVEIGDPAAPTTITAVPIDLPGGMRVAALAFDQMQPYQAAIHGADGRTLSVATG